jgi:ribonuclease E
MSKTLVLVEQTKIAALYKDNKNIADLIVDTEHYEIGNIYMGIVETILPSINAAFINLDYLTKNGFIHAKNLGHLKQKGKNSNITNHLLCNSFVMVQILKAPTGNKGPTLTGEITLEGRYLNLLVFKKGITFSKDFGDNEEMFYFKTVFSLLKPKAVGILIKKTALYANFSNIIQDFYCLLYEWDTICKNITFQSPPFLISKNKNFISKVLQKVYTDDILNIVVDSDKASQKIAFIVNRWAEKKSSILSIRYFKNYNFIIRDYNLDLIIYDLLQSRINLSGGAYVILEKTEALTTIDVNSGSFNYCNNPRETILLVNRKAAKQIAKHIKLRNISGVIIIDFIDMKNQQDQLNLLIYFDLLLKNDEQRPKIVQFSELGLIELTRKRQWKSLQEIFHNKIIVSENSNNTVYISNIISKNSLGHSLLLNTILFYSI